VPNIVLHDLLIGDGDIQREVRWMRVAGYSFAADLLEAVWAELGRVEESAERRSSKNAGSAGR
jgi:hypothetical protein